MRAQSHVVGVALLLGIAVVALGAMTVGVGGLLDAQAANADAGRVAGDLDEALTGVDRTGYHSHELTFAEGRLSTTDRTLRVLRNGTVVATHDVGAVVFENGNRRVTAVAGAVVRGNEGNAWLVSDPPVTHSEANGVLVVGAPVLDAEHTAVAGEGGVRTTLETTVDHSQRDLGTGEFALAIETETPGPLARHFESQNATTTRRTFAGDDHSSVVAHYPGVRRGYLVVHDLDLEVTNG